LKLVGTFYFIGRMVVTMFIVNFYGV